MKLLPWLRRLLCIDLGPVTANCLMVVVAPPRCQCHCESEARRSSWMLLVELLRTKVETILVNVGAQSYSSTMDRASRISWLGYLVFYSLSGTGKKAIYGTLWVFAAAKLLQRVAINELLKRSFTYGRNAEQLGWYMDLILRRNKKQDQHPDDDGGPAELLKRVKKAAVPIEVKESIVEYLVAHVVVDGDSDAAAPLSNGWSTLWSEKHCSSRHLSKACESKSLAEVILTWHIATSLLELKYPLEKKARMGAHRKVATTLSRYTAYLVASCPELLPDDTEGTKRVYANVKEELKKVMGGCWRYHVSLEGTVYNKLVNIALAQRRRRRPWWCTREHSWGTS
ncbi:unnamed protein product [Miscanthus lutarioriparius]|uniref:DUF4220 domain-containing protein n=1 Tax=Miscanthus lutarioriparius TaxID=422564 RepID=A0A811RCM8_9POAL|nr:unnamed protein product [Miscanthus lutarioriparius]